MGPFAFGESPSPNNNIRYTRHVQGCQCTSIFTKQKSQKDPFAHFLCGR